MNIDEMALARTIAQVRVRFFNSREVHAIDEVSRAIMGMLEADHQGFDGTPFCRVCHGLDALPLWPLYEAAGPDPEEVAQRKRDLMRQARKARWAKRSALGAR